MNPASVREAFIKFFQGKGHTFVKSAPILPHDDPTLLFINAGMNQFKPLFMGACETGHPFHGLKRACNTQKCIRAGGKHNDLDDVGKDVYHHTFFEMLGNWSFGDYFKEEAIDWAWELLTQVYKLPEAQLYVTYYGGDPVQPDVPADLESKALWAKYLPEDRIISSSFKDNFWEMGKEGPCGPCSEIHFDRIGGRDAAALVNQDDPDVLEIWNLVFMQFNREADQRLTNLPCKSVDTGMGLERLCSILANQPSNYDTELFDPLFSEIRKLAQAEGLDLPAYSGKLGASPEGVRDTAYRVVADHIRTLVIAISDGVRPSNDGRGYVLRRILRRAVRYLKDSLGVQSNIFHLLVPTVVQSLGSTFPELNTQQEQVARWIHEEEQSFASSLTRGLREFHTRKTRVMKAGASEFGGQDAFDLYTSYGFPVDLTQILAEEAGLQLDLPGFHRLMEDFREQGRKGGAYVANYALSAPLLNELSKKAEQTVDAPKYSWDPQLVGQVYGHPAQVVGIFNGEAWVDSLENAETCGLVLNETSFYAEAGGQLYDSGSILVGDQVLDVRNVQKYGGYVLHEVSSAGFFSATVGQSVVCQVNYDQRALVGRNHSATHLLNWALRKVLGGQTGEDVHQKGSACEHHRLRFDFSHNKPVTLEELQQIEELVVGAIKSNWPIYKKEVPFEVSQRIEGLGFMVGETYPAHVRVVSMGQPIDSLVREEPTPITNFADLQTSVELCGGTHMAATGDLGGFVILSEEGTAKGVRRLQCATHLMVDHHHQELDKEEAKFAAALVASSEETLDERAKNMARINQEVSAGFFPLIRKRQLLEKIGAEKKRILELQKAEDKKFLEKAKAFGAECVKQIQATSEESNGKFVFTQAAASGEVKHGVAALEVILKQTKVQQVYLLQEGPETCVLVFQTQDGTVAKERQQALAQEFGGQGGGNATRGNLTCAKSHLAGLQAAILSGF